MSVYIGKYHQICGSPSKLFVYSRVICSPPIFLLAKNLFWGCLKMTAYTMGTSVQWWNWQEDWEVQTWHLKFFCGETSLSKWGVLKFAENESRNWDGRKWTLLTTARRLGMSEFDDCYNRGSTLTENERAEPNEKRCKKYANCLKNMRTAWKVCRVHKKYADCIKSRQTA